MNAQHVDPELPSLSTICRRFGGWQNALEEVGQTRVRVTRRYTDADIRDGLRKWMASDGDRRAETYNKTATQMGLPSFNTVVLRFGSWRAALEGIGEEPMGRRWTRDEVLIAVTRWFERHHHSTSVAYRRAAATDDSLPSLLTVIAKLGTWVQVVEFVAAERQRSGVVDSR